MYALPYTYSSEYLFLCCCFVFNRRIAVMRWLPWQISVFYLRPVPGLIPYLHKSLIRMCGSSDSNTHSLQRAGWVSSDAGAGNYCYVLCKNVETGQNHCGLWRHHACMKLPDILRKRSLLKNRKPQVAIFRRATSALRSMRPNQLECFQNTVP